MVEVQVKTSFFLFMIFGHDFFLGLVRQVSTGRSILQYPEFVSFCCFPGFKRIIVSWSEGRVVFSMLLYLLL
jgi:hypothetical protein